MDNSIENMGTEIKESEDYYKKGSSHKRQTTVVTLKNLEQRRKLTGNPKLVVIVLVGLPGRGKSFFCRKVQSLLSWRGSSCKAFNVGKYRRKAQDIGPSSADFFDSKNEAMVKLREDVAKEALVDMLDWLSFDEGHIEGYQRVGIYDATNSTRARRDMILDVCSSRSESLGGGKNTISVIFLEIICNNEELLEENFQYKAKNSPDYIGFTEEAAILDLSKRAKKYEERYETLDDDSQSYIKVFNLSSKILTNLIFGKIAKTLVPALIAWNVGTRPIWICRAGETEESGDLGPLGIKFRDALKVFMKNELKEFVSERTSSVSGRQNSLYSSMMSSGDEQDPASSSHFRHCKVMTSTMPRAIKTGTSEDPSYEMEIYSYLNPLDKGDFNGNCMSHIKSKHPEWYVKATKDPYNTRFPGGECYADLMERLESCISEIEQEVIPVLVVSHISIIQLLLAYFRNSPVEECTSVSIPLHTVFKFSPEMGGGWIENQITLVEEKSWNLASSPKSPSPIWEGLALLGRGRS